MANNLSFLTKSKFTKKNGKKFNQQGLTFDWTGKNNSDEILSLYKVNKSINYDEFLQSFNTWCTPGLNFHYINKNGDYKILPAGNSPIRFEKHNPLIPQIRSSSLTGWKEQIKLQKYYQIDDTAKNGYLVSANNKLFISKDYISNYWEPISRFDRINEVLSLEKPHNVPRAKYLQNDLLSPYAKQLLKICLPIIIDKKILLNSLEKQALNKLCRWNYILSSKDNTSSVYTLFFYNLLKCTFQDELGDKLFSEYTFISSVSTRKIFELIDENKSNVFDNVRTKEIENRNYTIFIAFKNAVKQGTQLFGTDDISKWKYGLIHTIEPEHILSRNKFIKNVFEIGKYPIGGNNTTILNTDWNYSVPFSSVVYPSVRFVCDLSDTNIYFSLPGGVSGNPQNSNFKDQFQLWLNGGYISISLSKNPNSNFKLKTLIKKKK